MGDMNVSCILDGRQPNVIASPHGRDQEGKADLKAFAPSFATGASFAHDFFATNRKNDDEDVTRC